MQQGGARVNSGRPPDPNSLRSLKGAGDWVTLPSEGRQGEPPEWPLDGQVAREAYFWKRLWKKPQAVMWERLGQEVEVALYVRNLIGAEKHGAPVNLGTLTRQGADALGLTIPGMRLNRWKIAKDEVTERRDDKSTPAQPSARDRLGLVRNAEAG